MMLGAVLFWLLLLGGLVLLVVWLVQQVTQRAAPEVRPRSALELLEQRYARGEIDREEYLARRQDLTQAA
ncbi:MAG: SHOCT domain-containing protein [Chloroflexi bacterium]|nr:SHOCT domain-containing protein [Chloroflexota bacterium]